LACRPLIPKSAISLVTSRRTRFKTAGVGGKNLLFRALAHDVQRQQGGVLQGREIA
jgi:hypothetical protein